MSNQKKVKVDELIVTVTYSVSLLEFEMPEDVHKEITKAADEEDKIIVNSFLYGNAQEWLAENCKESDCMDWEAEIYDIITPKKEKQ